MALGKLIGRRLALLVVVLLGVTFLTFVISHMVPGDPARLLAGDKASAETVQRIRQELGLDQPVLIQYGRYLRGLLQGDLGLSLRTLHPVQADLRTFFPATIELALVSLTLAVLVGIPLGVISAVRKDTLVDHVNRVIAIAGVSTPIFWFGLMAMLIFYRKLGWFPGSERLDTFLTPAPRVTGLYLADSLLAGNWAVFRNAVWHLTLPALCLSYIHVAAISRMVRSSMLEVLNQDYIRTAMAAGLPRRVIVYRHALRNALIPTVTMLGIAFGELLGGAVLTETIFSWPGMGKYVVDSIASLDFPAIMGFTLVTATGYVLLNLLVDLSYPLLNPQIRGVE